MNGFNKLVEVEKNGKKGKQNTVFQIDFSTIHSCKLKIDIAALLLGEPIQTSRSSIEVMTFEFILRIYGILCPFTKRNFVIVSLFGSKSI